MTLDSDNIRFTRILAGFPGKGASYNSEVIENVFFRTYYLVPCRLSADAKIRDLEESFYVICSLLRTATD